MDFSIFHRDGPLLESDLKNAGSWDILISAYNESDRIALTFEKIKCTHKFWFVQHEYAIEEQSLPSSNLPIIASKPDDRESTSIKGLIDRVKEILSISDSEIREKRICIDSTGFLRPNLLFLILYLYRVVKIDKFTVIYSEPTTYKNAEDTEFSIGPSLETRIVDGFSGDIGGNQSQDLLIIGAGFETKLLAELLNFKSHAKKMLLLGFPSLQPDMYQQARLRSHGLELTKIEEKPYFAPANDPFATAEIVKELVDKQKRSKGVSNLFLSSLGTKPQVIGFCLYYIYAFLEAKEQSMGGILFPFKERYSKETSVGFSKAWLYTIEFPLTN